MQHCLCTITLQVDLLDMLYRKSLRLGVDVRNARGIGTVVNLQSNDARKVWMMPVHIHTLWNSPFQVCGTMVLALIAFLKSVLLSSITKLDSNALEFVLDSLKDRVMFPHSVFASNMFPACAQQITCYIGPTLPQLAQNAYVFVGMQCCTQSCRLLYVTGCQTHNSDSTYTLCV